jgi:hypothetical protein
MKYPLLSNLAYNQSVEEYIAAYCINEFSTKYNTYVN